MATMTRVTSSKVADFWMNGKPVQNSNGQFYSPDGVTLYSYGDHHVVGRRLNGGIVLINSSKVSPTTSKHTSYARRAVPSNSIREISDLTSKLKLFDAGKISIHELCADDA